MTTRSDLTQLQGLSVPLPQSSTDFYRNITISSECEITEGIPRMRRVALQHGLPDLSHVLVCLIHHASLSHTTSSTYSNLFSKLKYLSLLHLLSYRAAYINFNWQFISLQSYLQRHLQFIYQNFKPFTFSITLISHINIGVSALTPNLLTAIISFFFFCNAHHFIFPLLGHRCTITSAILQLFSLLGVTITFWCKLSVRSRS